MFDRVVRCTATVVCASLSLATAACSSNVENGDGTGGAWSAGAAGMAAGGASGAGGSGSGGRAGATAGGGAAGAGGGAACSEGNTNCGGSCVVLANDPQHCGACGHDCLGGACQAGKCQPVQLAMGPTTGWCIQVAGKSVLWAASGDISKTTDDGIFEVSDSGGSPKQVAPGKGAPRCLSVEGSSMAWTSLSDGSLWVASTDGANAKQVATTPSAYGIDLADGWVYWTTLASPGSVQRVAIGGGSVQVLSASQANPVQVRVDAAAGYAYFTTRGTAPAFTDGKLSRVPFTGGTTEVLATGLSNARGVALAGSSVFWTTRGTEGAYDDGTVGRVEATGGTPVTLATGLAGPGKGLAVDATHVYVATSPLSGGGSILRIPIAGGAVEPVASGQAAPADLALDDVSIYWVNELSGTVMRLAK